MISSQREYKMLDILYHTTDNDVTFSKHGVFHGIEYNIFSIDRLGGHFLKIQPISIDVFHIQIDIPIIIIMDLCCNLILFILVNTFRIL